MLEAEQDADEDLKDLIGEMELDGEAAAKFREAIGELKAAIEEAEQAANAAKEAAAKAAEEADEVTQRQAEEDGMDTAWSVLANLLELDSHGDSVDHKLKRMKSVHEWKLASQEGRHVKEQKRRKSVFTLKRATKEVVNQQKLLRSSDLLAEKERQVVVKDKQLEEMEQQLREQAAKIAELQAKYETQGLPPAPEPEPEAQ